MELGILILVVACIIWIVWKLRASSRASNDAALAQAWRLVLNDPNYLHRRRYEERKRDDDARARKEEGLQ